MAAHRLAIVRPPVVSGAAARYTIGMSATQRRPRPTQAPSFVDHSQCAHDPCRGPQPVALTPSRRRVLDALCAAGAPLGAYDLIDRLAAGSGKRPAPISVYRALDFLIDHGLVHRLASRSVFLACSKRHSRADAIVFLICEGCGRVAETASTEVAAALAKVAADVQFEPHAVAIELAGRCSECQKSDQPVASATKQERSLHAS